VPSATRKVSQEDWNSFIVHSNKMATLIGISIHVLNPPCREVTSTEQLTSVAFLPFVEPVFNHISRVLMRHNIKTVGLLPKKVTSFLWPIKDDLGLKTADLYCIPCECGEVYI
jgi:hypothetical protein